MWTVLIPLKALEREKVMMNHITVFPNTYIVGRKENHTDTEQTWQIYFCFSGHLRQMMSVLSVPVRDQENN